MSDSDGFHWSGGREISAPQPFLSPTPVPPGRDNPPGTRLLMNSKCHPGPFTELHFSYRWSLLVLLVTLIKISADKGDEQRCSGAETEYHKNWGCKWGCCCCLLVYVGNQDTLICCAFFHILINYVALFRILILSDSRLVQIKKGFNYRRIKRMVSSWMIWQSKNQQSSLRLEYANISGN